MASATSAASPITGYSSGYRWNLLLLLSASQMLWMFDRVNLSVAAPVLIKTYHYTPAMAGLLFSMFNWAFTLSLLPAGPLVDKTGPRVGYGIGFFITSAATFVCGLTSRMLPLSIFRAVVGVGEGPLIPSGQRVIFENFPKEQRAFAVGTYFAGARFGLALGIPFATILLHKWGLPSVFYVTGSLGCLWLVWFLLTYRPVPRPANLVRSNIRWRTLLRYRNTWGLMLGNAGYLYIYYVFASWLPGYLVLQRKMSILNSGFVGMLPFLVSVVATVSGGWIADGLVRRGIRVTVARKTMACGGLFSATVFTLLGAYSVGLWTAVTFLTLAIASFSLATASINSMAVDIAPPHAVSSLVSLQIFGGNVAGSFAPVVTGLLISSAGSFTTPLLVTAAVALVFGCGSFGLLVGNLDERLKELDVRISAQHEMGGRTRIM